MLFYPDSMIDSDAIRMAITGDAGLLERRTLRRFREDDVALSSVNRIAHNPTYEELAKIMHQVSVMIFELADDVDPMLSQKAAEYAYIMKRMGKAITDNDDKLLKELTEELDRKPGL